ncbi:unnamed protein product [Protopolystoma xenopodis]|uniref:Uncharacterized protein n=1 Tax=Protopolystoma xenopodis TaxID=117903 RepID=A0A3S5CLP6_9PLAT|nr:unnamed protein product [Protopolystoma xenopodis]
MSQAGFRVTGMLVYCAPLPYMAHQVGDYFSIRGFAATQKSPRVPMQWRKSFHVSLIAYVNPTILSRRIVGAARMRSGDDQPRLRQFVRGDTTLGACKPVCSEAQEAGRVMSS